MDKQNLLDMIAVAARLMENGNETDAAGQQLTETSALADNADMTDIGNELMNLSDRLYKNDANLSDLAGEIDNLAHKARDCIIGRLVEATLTVQDSSKTDEEAIQDGLNTAIAFLHGIRAREYAERLEVLLNVDGLDRNDILTSMAGVCSDLTDIPITKPWDEELFEKFDPADMVEISAPPNLRGGIVLDEVYGLGGSVFAGEIALPESPDDLDDENAFDSGNQLRVEVRKPRQEVLKAELAAAEKQTVDVIPAREQAPDNRVRVFRKGIRIAYVDASKIGALIKGGTVEANDELHYSNGRSVYVKDVPSFMEFLEDDAFFTEGETPEGADTIRKFLSSNPSLERVYGPKRTVNEKLFYLVISASFVLATIVLGVTYQVTPRPIEASVQDSFAYEPWNDVTDNEDFSMPPWLPTMEEIAAQKETSLAAIVEAEEKAEEEHFQQRKEKLRAALIAWKMQNKQKE